MAAEDGFSLFDAIGAIEIMDPKMDSGFRPPDELAEDYDITRRLTFNELIWICDRLLGCFAAWHKGFLLTQTLLTSHYVDQLLRKDGETWAKLISIHEELPTTDLFNARFLDLMCISIVKSIGFAINQIRESNAPIWEEEDISTQSYGLSLFSRISVSDVVGSVAVLLIMLDTEPFYNQAETELLQQYLNLAANMLNAFSKPGDYVFWGHASIALENIQESFDHTSLAPVPGAFTPRLQQRYASSTPMRGMVELELDDAFTILNEIFIRGELNSGFLNDYLPLRGSLFAVSNMTITIAV
jgi:hypothetical protein